MSNEEELKPCPFCGNLPTIHTHPGFNWDGAKGRGYNVGGCYGLWYVHCQSNDSYGEKADSCDMQPSTPFYPKLENAIKNWNKRAAINHGRNKKDGLR